MGPGIRGGAARQLQTLLEAGAIGSMTDAELLGRYLRRDDSAEPAFAALVERHGRMVLRVCFDTLRDSHEAQDAAQPAFPARRNAAVADSATHDGEIAAWDSEARATPTSAADGATPRRTSRSLSRSRPR